jgi:hypothetical protein
MGTLAEELRKYEEAHAFLRRLVLPEEDRARFTSARWQGEYRWFQSPNVIPIEKLRLLKWGRCEPSNAKGAA